MLNDFKNLKLWQNYKVMLQYLTSMGNPKISHYCTQDIVCPSTLKKGLVTTITVDNIDQPSSIYDNHFILT